MKIIQRILPLILLSCSFNVLFAQTNFNSLQITPQFPKQGDKLQFTYNPSSTPLRVSKKIESVVYTFNNTTETTPFLLHEINLKRNKDKTYSGRTGITFRG
jgi:hypothetical protein